MDVTMEMPTAVEGKWQLKDAKGQVIACQATHPGAVMVINPHFYRGQYSQTLMRASVTGKRGRKANAAFKIGATTGQLKTESTDKVQTPVEPAFDKPPTKGKAGK